MFNRQYLTATAERAVKTFAQAAVAILVGNGSGLLDADWAGVASVAGMAALISVLTSIAGPGDGPSAIGAERLAE